MLGVARDYRQLSAAELAGLRLEAKAATCLHRLGPGGDGLPAPSNVTKDVLIAVARSSALELARGGGLQQARAVHRAKTLVAHKGHLAESRAVAVSQAQDAAAFVESHPSLAACCLFQEAPPSAKRLRVLGTRDNLTTCSWCPPQVDLAKVALNNLTPAGREAVLRDWEAAHDMVQHAEQEPLKASKQLPVCFWAGRCLCCPAAQTLVRFERALIKGLKHLFRPKTQPRKLLQDGLVVLKISSEDANTWFHVSYANLNNWHLILMSLLPSIALPDCLAAVEPTWGLTWDFFQDFDFAQSWECHVHLLGRSPGRRLDQLDPSQLRVFQYLPAFEFWEGTPLDGDVGGDPPDPGGQPAPATPRAGDEELGGPSDRTEGPEPQDVVDAELAALGDILEAGIELDDIGAFSDMGPEFMSRPIRRRQRPPGKKDAARQPVGAAVPLELPPAGSADPPLAAPPSPADGPPLVVVDPPPLAVEPPPAPPAHLGSPRPKRRLERADSDAPRGPRHDPYPRFYHPIDKQSFVRLVDVPEDDKKDMKAFCGVHPGCTLTRTLKVGPRSHCRPFAGLYTWLGMARPASEQTAKEHQKDAPDLASRNRIRLELMAKPESNFF
jgi:hypothetical protein